MNAEQLVESVRKHAKTVLLPSVAQAIVRELEVQKPPYTCIFCGAPSWVDPFDQEAPPDYCHESDHGEPPEQEAQPLFILHTGAFFGNEQDEWEVEAISQERVADYCRERSSQHDPLYAVPPDAARRIAELEELLRVSGQAYEIAANMAEERDARIAELEAEVKHLEGLVYAPGLWRCAKCNFTLIQKNLNANNGAVTPRDQAGDKCPNCKVPLWRVTEREDAIQLGQQLECVFNEKRAVEAELTEARKDAERYRWLRHGDNDAELLEFSSSTDWEAYDVWLLRREALDAAIDAAIAKEKSND